MSNLSITWEPHSEYRVVLFYRYVLIPDDQVQIVISFYLKFLQELGVLGRLLVATEGVNGTLAGSPAAISAFVDTMTQDSRFSGIDWKYSSGTGEHLPFLGLSVRQAKELICPGTAVGHFIQEQLSFDETSFGGLSGTGIHLNPQEFDAGTCDFVMKRKHRHE